MCSRFLIVLVAAISIHSNVVYAEPSNPSYNKHGFFDKGNRKMKNDTGKFPEYN